MSAAGSEFRQRGVNRSQAQAPPPPQRRASTSSSLPRPGYSSAPRPSPKPIQRQNRSFSNSSIGGSVPFSSSPSSSQAQRSGSFTGYPSTAQAYNPNASSSSLNSGYGGYGGSANTTMNGGYGMNGAGASNGMSNNVGYGRDDADQNKYGKKPNRKGGSSSFTGGMGFVVGGIGLFCYAILMTTLYWSKSSQTKSMLSRLDLPDTLTVIETMESIKRQLKSSESMRQRNEQATKSKHSNEINTLERSNRMLKEQLEHHTDVVVPEARGKIEKHTRREKAFADQIGWLMDATRRESKRMVLERFGAGPHKVSVHYLIPEDPLKSDGPKIKKKFQIDLAPLDLVPHAIHLFLEQVDHGLLDGTHFYLNGPHIVQAGPQPEWGHTAVDGNDDTFYQHHPKKEELSNSAIGTMEKYEKQAQKKKQEDHDDRFDDDDDDMYENYFNEEDYAIEDKRTQRFADMGLEQLAFPDYHQEWPHDAWTVGFTGRPGGPDWYINKVDNRQGHGPGGQYQYALNEQGDSCFGVISGGPQREEVVKDIYTGGIYGDNSEWHHFMTHPIEIAHAEILTKEPMMDKHIHLTHLKSQHKVYNHRKKHRHIDEELLPESTIHHGEGVDPNSLPNHLKERLAYKKKGAKISINKVKHGHRPHIDGAAEA